VSRNRPDSPSTRRLVRGIREASWEEALEVAAKGLRDIRDADGKGAGRYALAGFGSAKGSNEEAYLFQKLVRTGFARTMSTTARAFAMPPRSPLCSKASAPARFRTR